MEIKQCLLTKNDCYKTARKITPAGIVVHSTGANNPYLRRYVQPDDGILGINKNNNSWNRSGLDVCVHAFIGKDKNNDVRVYQTLPFDYACWGVANGSKGSYNYNPAYIQFEICEDDLTNKEYFEKAFDLASEFCAYLIKRFNLKLENVVSHHEAHLRGYGSNHADCDHWLKRFGKTMDDFRAMVKDKMEPIPTPSPSDLKIEKIDKKKIKLNKNANLWNLDFDNWNEAKSVKTYEKNTIIENIVAIAYHKLGGKYYMTEYSYSNNIHNGFNVVDCEDVEEFVTYTVKKGDNLSKIAQKYNTTWQKIYEDNKDVIGDNPNLIKPGQVLIMK